MQLQQSSCGGLDLDVEEMNSVGDTIFDNEHNQNRIVSKSNITNNKINEKRTYADVVKMSVTENGTGFQGKNRIMRNKKMISWKRDH